MKIKICTGFTPQKVEAMANSAMEQLILQGCDIININTSTRAIRGRTSDEIVITIIYNELIITDKMIDMSHDRIADMNAFIEYGEQEYGLTLVAKDEETEEVDSNEDH